MEGIGTGAGVPSRDRWPQPLELRPRCRRLRRAIRWVCPRSRSAREHDRGHSRHLRRRWLLPGVLHRRGLRLRRCEVPGGANTLAHINAPIVGISVDSATSGYWLVGWDGGIYAFGAPFHGSAGGTQLNQPIVGISAVTDGSGYYLVAGDGGVFAYDAPFLGSMGGAHLNAPVVGITTAG